jgi:hypothetical protein
VQPGSLDSEAGIYDMSYDMSGSRWVAGLAGLARASSGRSCLHIHRPRRPVALQRRGEQFCRRTDCSRLPAGSTVHQL